MKFIVDLWMDGYSSEEEMNAACKEFIKEQLDFTATSVQIEEYAASRDSRMLSAVPSEEESEIERSKYTISAYEMIGWRACYSWMIKELKQRGIAG